MKIKMYKGSNGSTQMISSDNAYAEIKEMGHIFAVALAEVGHKTEESDLMNGLAAYTLLNLEGQWPRIDAAYKMVLRDITDVMFERARAQVREA